MWSGQWTYDTGVNNSIIVSCLIFTLFAPKLVSCLSQELSASGENILDLSLVRNKLSEYYEDPSLFS